MGGSVTMIIRESEDKVHKMVRWTNSFPHFIKHPKFLSKDKTHLNEYLVHWNEMSEDYEENKKTGNFKYNMTDVYIPDSGHIAPVEYGIVFIDFVKNKIISCQGYSSINKIPMSSVLTAYRQRSQKDWEDTLFGIRDLYDANLLSLKTYDESKSLSSLNKALSNKKLSFLDKIEIVKKDMDTALGCYFEMDLSPFEVIDNYDDLKGFKKTYKEIKELITLTKEDEKRWKKYLKERSSD